jgi:SAM-dependent methyltransferase
MSSSTDVNRAHWDALAQVHGQGSDHYYDVDALVAGHSSLGVAERAGVEAAVDTVDGKDVLHVQCHLGFDAVSLSRLGARVTGVDFSPASLAKARQVADRCGVEIAYVEADSTDLPPSLHGRFDLAYATIGVLGWIEDLDAWMRSVAATLRPGGRLLLVELHPLFGMFASLDPLVADFPYAFSGPVEFDEQGSYADADAELAASKSVEFAHALGEVVTAAVRAGLRVLSLVEHLESEFDPRGRVLPREPDGLHRMRLGGLPAPVLYTLVAER